MKNHTCLFLFFFPLLLSGCATTPQPHNVNNICSIFYEYPKWYWAAQKTEERWHMPINVQMAVLHQESHFKADAKPPRQKLLWVIPWLRPSSSYGYTQALHETWENYKKSTGKRFTSRDNFTDAVDFVGWYGAQAQKRAGIKPNDAYRLYLAYHEGVGGYMRKTYAKKAWLLAVARKVSRQSVKYRGQLASCHARLQRKPWYRVW